MLSCISLAGLSVTGGLRATDLITSAGESTSAHAWLWHAVLILRLFLSSSTHLSRRSWRWHAWWVWQLLFCSVSHLCQSDTCYSTNVSTWTVHFCLNLLLRVLNMQIKVKTNMHWQTTTWMVWHYGTVITHSHLANTWPKSQSESLPQAELHPKYITAHTKEGTTT